MRTIIIAGMPRSGTSWLGQIVNSSPRIAFRTEPLFAYRFKNKIGTSSSCEQVNEFLSSLINLEDEFILQKDKERAGHYPTFEKIDAEVLVFKTTRHHELLDKYLTCVPGIHIVGLVRHPAGAINSWLKSEREFHKKRCRREDDWRSGKCRKQGIGEYWGFNDWLAVTRQFVELENEYPNFHIIRYCDLVTNTHVSVERLFHQIGIEMQDQTRQFIIACHSKHDDDPYAVFKRKAVADEWRNELDPTIAETIISEVCASGLSYFLC